MTLNLKNFVSGQLGNNIILLYDDVTKKAVVVDPSLDPHLVMEFTQEQKLEVESIWITHGHFDHFTSVHYLCSKLPVRPKVFLHKDDLDLWRDGGGAKNFGMMMSPPEDPDEFFEDGQQLTIGSHPVEIRLAPGHSQGSVIIVLPELHSALCGDVIFYHGIGRTDLDGGDFDTLMTSIKTQVFTLPPETILIPGHGPDTTVAEEMKNNPFIE